MTDERKAEAGEVAGDGAVIIWEHVGYRYELTCWETPPGGNRRRCYVTEGDLRRAGFVPAASLAAAEARIESAQPPPASPPAKIQLREPTQSKTPPAGIPLLDCQPEPASDAGGEKSTCIKCSPCREFVEYSNGGRRFCERVAGHDGQHFLGLTQDKPAGGWPLPQPPPSGQVASEGLMAEPGRLSQRDPFWALDSAKLHLRDLRDYTPADSNLSLACYALRDAVEYLLLRCPSAVATRDERLSDELSKGPK